MCRVKLCAADVVWWEVPITVQSTAFLSKETKGGSALITSG